MGTSDCWNYLVSLGVQHLSWQDSLLAEGLVACSPLTKIPSIDVDEEEFFHPRYGIFLADRCWFNLDVEVSKE